MARSTRSISLSVMEADAFPEVLERAELELFDRTLRSIQHRRDITDTLVFHEPHLDDAALQVGQAIDELKEADPALQFLVHALIGQIRRRLLRLASLTTPVVRHCVRGGPVQPCREWHTTPLETRQVRQRLLKDLRRDVFGNGAAAGA